MKSYHFFLCIYFILIISGCGKSSEPSAKTSPFHSLEVYFNNEIKTLEHSKRLLRKQIQTNEKSEELVISNPDWKKELSIFTSCISGKKLTESSFQRDSIKTGDYYKIQYTGIDDHVEIKSLVVYQAHTTPDSIVIITKVDNMYYRTLDTLIYLGNGNYRISALNEPSLGKNIRFVLTGRSE